MAVLTAPKYLQSRGPAKVVNKILAAESGAYVEGSLLFKDVAADKGNRTAGAGDTFLGFVASTVTAVADETYIYYEDANAAEGGTQYLMTLAAVGVGDHRKLVFSPLSGNDPDLCAVDGAGQTNFPCIGKVVQRVSATTAWVDVTDRSADAVGTA